MATATGSVISRVCEGELNLDVEFRYEAEYGYEVVDREFLERNMGGNPPAGLLEQSFTTSFMRAFERAYPNGLSPAEMERPDERLLMRNLEELVDEEWKRFFGIGLSSFTLRSFRADPTALALIQRLRSALKTPQQMAQEMIEKMQAAKEAAISSRQVKCAYCDCVVTAQPDGSCPACGAPLR